MANFDEDIRRITNEVLQDGTVDRIIREKVTVEIENSLNGRFQCIKNITAMLMELNEQERLKVEGVVTGILMAKQIESENKSKQDNEPGKYQK